MLIHHAPIAITPTFIFGCGGTGASAVDHCRSLFLQECLNGDKNRLKEAHPISFYLIDSVHQSKHDTQTIAVAADDVHYYLNNPSHPTAGDTVQGVFSHLPQDRDYKSILSGFPNSKAGCGTCPPIGRINFLATWERTYSEIKNQFKKNWAGLPREASPNVFIVAGLYGGTGSGTHLDLAAMLRLILKELEIAASIFGIFMLPDIVGASKPELLQANTYACLKEIDHFVSGNPYVITMTTGRQQCVTNDGDDMMFNRVFLINNQNLDQGTPGEDLSYDQVCDMVGETLFHWSCTSLGKSINQRLIDHKSRDTQYFAPKGQPEQRFRGYATFGLATARIPYDTIRANMVLDYAFEIVRDLCTDGNRDTHQENEYIKKVIKQFDVEYGEKGLLKLIPLNGKDLGRYLKFSRVDFLSWDIEQRLRDKEETVENLYQLITTQLDKLRQEDNRLDDTLAGIQDAIQSEVREMRKYMVSKGGPRLAKSALDMVISTIQKRVAELKTDTISRYEAGLRLEKYRENARQSMDKWLQANSISRLRNRTGLVSECTQSWTNLKRQATDFRSSMENYALPLILGYFNDAANSEKLSLDETDVKFEAIKTNILQKKRSYDKDLLHFKPIEDIVFTNYIDTFTYPAYQHHYDKADEIRKNGLAITGTDGERLTIYPADFEQYPEQVTSALLSLAEKVVKEHAAPFLYRSFSESGFFPLSWAEASDNWKLHIYENTSKELKKRSIPYLRYREHGFSSIKEAYIIYPATSDAESEEWTKYLAVSGDNFAFRGVTTDGPYCISCFQMHAVIPLYCIDGMEQWKMSYHEQMAYSTQPLHKFSLVMKEPYITCDSPISLGEPQCRELFKWAHTVTEAGPGRAFPIFYKYFPDIWILNGNEEKPIMEFHYESTGPKYRDMDAFKNALLDGKLSWKALKEFIDNCLNSPTDSTLKTFAYKHVDITQNYSTNAHRRDESVARNAVIDFFKALYDDGTVNDDWIKISKGTGIYVNPACISNTDVKSAFEQFFLQNLPNPTAIERSEDDIIKHIYEDDGYRLLFVGKCLEAMQNLGNILPPLPTCLEELTKKR